MVLRKNGVDMTNGEAGNPASGISRDGIPMVKTGDGIREDKTGKGRCDLLPMCSLLRLAKHFEKGNEDHPERNWEKGLPMHGYIDSALRHLFKYMDGSTDEDHLCAAAWNILCAMWTEEKKPNMQDIPTRMPGECGYNSTGNSKTYLEIKRGLNEQGS